MGQQPGIANVKDLRCPPGRYFTKVKARKGALVDKVQLWCNDGSYFEQGGGGGEETPEFSCDRGFDQIRLRVGNNLDQIQFRCSDGRWSDKWGGNGGSEYLRTNCSDVSKVLTGLVGLGTKDNVIALGSDVERTIECGDRQDCLADANLFHNECKNRKDTAYQNKLEEFCNRNDANANSSNCINWCNDNRSRCTLLNDLNDCVKYNITRGECNRSRINEIEAECKKYRIIASEVGAAGQYQCNPNSLNKLKSECKELGIEDSCSPTAVDDAMERKLQLDMDERLRKEAQQRYEDSQKRAAERYAQTQAMIAQTMGVQIPKETQQIEQPTTPTEGESDQQMYIIIAIIIILLLSSSSLVSAVFLLPE